MKRSTEIITGTSLMLTYAAFSVWMFCMARIQNEFSVMRAGAWQAAFYALAAYYVNLIFTSRGMNLSLYAAINLLFAIGGGVLFAKCAMLEPDGTGTRVFCSIVYSLCAFAGAYAAALPPKRQTPEICFEMQAAMLAILLLLKHFIPLPALPQAAAMCIAAVGVTLLALVSARVDAEGSANSASGSPAAGRAMIALCFLLVAGVIFIIVLFASGGVQSLSEACLAVLRAISAGIMAALMFAGRLIERFMAWLSAFFPDSAGELLSSGQEAAASAEVYVEEPGEVPASAWVILAIFVAAAAALVIFLLRRHRLSVRRTVRRRAYREKRRSGLADAIRAAAAALRERLYFAFLCLRFRSSAPALLVRCEKRARRVLPRNSGESGEKYLLRLSQLDFSPELSAALRELSSCVEKAFYSACPAPVPSEVCRTVRRAHFRASGVDTAGKRD